MWLGAATVFIHDRVFVWLNYNHFFQIKGIKKK